MNLNRKRVLIGPIDIAGTTSVDASELINPGIGGSEMHSIVLANVLSANFEVTLWARTGPVPQGAFQVVRYPLNFSDFDIQISYTSNSQSKERELPPLIAISHHPFDDKIVSLPTRTVAVVNVGRFQLLSNQKKSKIRGISQIWLPHFLPEPIKSYSPKGQTKRIVAGHLSSLHPSKGFLIVLKGWIKFLGNSENGSQLRVIGGISLYGVEESHPTLPTEVRFGNKLLRQMRGNGGASVVFLGRMTGGVSPEIEKWDLAILNPKGWGESESLSMKDCWRVGVPVVTGNRFGHRDYMMDFPELHASSPRQIARTLRHYREGKLHRADLSARALENYSKLVQRGHLSTEKWVELVTLATEEPLSSIASCGLPLGNVTIGQKFAVRVDGSRMAVLNTLIRVLSLTRLVFGGFSNESQRREK